MVKLAYNICTKAKELANAYPGIVIVLFIPSAWEKIIIRSKDTEFNLHDYIKSHGAQNHYTTQMIKESSINNGRMRGRIYWWLSLAIFVKSGRIPWSLGSLDERTAYAGIGFSLQHEVENRVKTVVGCSHLYNHFGQGLNFKLRKVDHPQFDFKKNPYLDEDEAYYFGISIIELFRDSSSKNPDRLVIHKRTPFKDSEIRGIVNAVSPYVKKIDLVSIEREEYVKLTSMRTSGSCLVPKYTPVKRGTCIVVSATEALLWTQGSINSIETPDKEYYPGGKGTPMPLRIKRFHGSSPIEQLASEILSFTKINCNSFDFYSTMPATIDSSNLVARIGKRLNHYNGNTFEFRYFI